MEICAWIILHLSQLGSTPGNLFDNLSFDQWTLWSILHCSKPCLAQIEDVWTLFSILDQFSSEKSFPKSCSHLFLIMSRDGLCGENKLTYKIEIIPLKDLKDNNVSKSVWEGIVGKWLNCFLTKSRTWRYLKKLVRAMPNSSQSCWNEAKCPFRKRSWRFLIPIFCQCKKALSTNEGGNMWFACRGALIERLCHPYRFRICFQIFRVANRIGFFVKGTKVAANEE